MIATERSGQAMTPSTMVTTASPIDSHEMRSRIAVRVTMVLPQLSRETGGYPGRSHNVNVGCRDRLPRLGVCGFVIHWLFSSFAPHEKRGLRESQWITAT